MDDDELSVVYIRSGQDKGGYYGAIAHSLWVQSWRL